MPTIKVNVQQNSIPTIKIKAVGGQIVPSDPVLVSANMGAIGRLDALTDVEETGTPLAGAVPVYDPNNDKYVITQLDFDDLTGDANIDGGGF